jgi:hypothetical protein
VLSAKEVRVIAAALTSALDFRKSRRVIPFDLIASLE